MLVQLFTVFYVVLLKLLDMCDSALLLLITILVHSIFLCWLQTFLVLLLSCEKFIKAMICASKPTRRPGFSKLCDSNLTLRIVWHWELFSVYRPRRMCVYDAFTIRDPSFSIDIVFLFSLGALVSLVTSSMHFIRLFTFLCALALLAVVAKSSCKTSSLSLFPCKSIFLWKCR